MKKFFLLLLAVAALGALFFYHQKMESDKLSSHTAQIYDAEPVYHQTTASPLNESAPNESSQNESAPNESSSKRTDFEIPAWTVAKIQSMDAGTVLLEVMLDPDTIPALFNSIPIDDTVKERIWNISYPEDATVALSDLRYLRVLHRGFDGETHIGELIVNKSIADDVLEIFYELYLMNYPIEKMVLIDAYDGDDIASMEDNNTSAFNYRKGTYSDTLSNHSYGMAIDINPLYNPYVVEASGSTIVSPESGAAYADRSADFPYKMDADDPCVQLFKAHGFAWGGDWDSPKDYQHFEQYVAQ